MADDSISLLVVEDDARLAQGLRRNLELDGFSVHTAGTGEEALEAIAGDANRFDLVVLDIMLPGVDGLEVCRRLRGDGHLVPILFLTARGSDADRILGLQIGADDYLPKPFVYDELVVRIRGIMRRAEWSRSPPRRGSTFTIGEFTVDVDQLQATTREGNTTLTEREVMLLRFFHENEGRVVSRGELLETVWGYSFDTATRTLDTFIHRLRKYFEAEPRHPRHFHTVRGVGYRYTGDASD